FEGSVFRFFQPAFWRLRKILRERYDFARHAVAPGYSKILEELNRLHETQAALEETRRVAQREWHTSDIAEFQTTVDATRNGSAHPSVRSLIPRLVGSPDGRTLALTLAE